MVIGRGYKSYWYSYNDSSHPTTEISIDFGKEQTVHSIQLVNNCYNDDYQKVIGSSHVRLGNDSAAWSESNAVVKDNIVDGGSFKLEGLPKG